MQSSIEPGDAVYVVLRERYVFGRALKMDDEGYMIIEFDDKRSGPDTMRYKPEQLSPVRGLPPRIKDGSPFKQTAAKPSPFCDADGDIIRPGFVVGELPGARAENVNLGRMGVVRRFAGGGMLVDVAWEKYRSGLTQCSKVIVLSRNEPLQVPNPRQPPKPLILGDAPVTTPRSDSLLASVQNIDLYLNHEGLSEGQEWWAYVMKRLEELARASERPFGGDLYQRYKDVQRRAKGLSAGEKLKEYVP